MDKPVALWKVNECRVCPMRHALLNGGWYCAARPDLRVDDHLVGAPPNKCRLRIADLHVILDAPLDTQPQQDPENPER